MKLNCNLLYLNEPYIIYRVCVHSELCIIETFLSSRLTDRKTQEFRIFRRGIPIVFSLIN